MLPYCTLQPLRAEVIGNELAWPGATAQESYIPLEKLRRACPCAACGGEPDVMGHVASASRQLRPAEFRAARASSFVGGYALQPTWNDGHDTGLYTFPPSSAPSTKMPPREFITPRDKREELKTYRELDAAPRSQVEGPAPPRRGQRLAARARRRLGHATLSDRRDDAVTARSGWKSSGSFSCRRGKPASTFPSIFSCASSSRASRRSPTRNSPRRIGTRPCAMSRSRRWVAR